MNNDWVINELSNFIHLSKQNGFIHGTWQPNTVGTEEQILKAWAICKTILDREEPGWNLVGSPTVGFEWELKREAAIRVEERLKRQSEIEENLGIGAILSKSSDVHPVLYENCKKLWEDGHFREVVQRAGTVVDSYLQDKLNRFDKSGTSLINDSFKGSSVNGNAYLKPPTLKNAESETSFMEGLHYLGLACIKYIRNLGTHDLDQLTENETLQRLMTMSLYLYGLDQCSVAN